MDESQEVVKHTIDCIISTRQNLEYVGVPLHVNASPLTPMESPSNLSPFKPVFPQTCLPKIKPCVRCACHPNPLPDHPQQTRPHVECSTVDIQTTPFIAVYSPSHCFE